jgi:plastocyanin
LLLAGACGDDDDDADKIDKLGDQQVNDHGTEDVTGKSEVEFETDNFYFGPTFLRGAAGQTLKLEIENEGDAKHNFTLMGSAIDTDIEPGAKAEIQVTFPASGVALFFCKYHRAQGMVGELLVGAAQPAAVTAP